MTTWITVCDTCKREDWEQRKDPETDGERLHALIAAKTADSPDVQVRRHSCLMGCKRACNVAIQAEGKLAYTLGELDPTPDTARAIVDYAVLHAGSKTGQVAYREWPDGVKGHFVTRHPPLPNGRE